MSRRVSALAIVAAAALVGLPALSGCTQAAPKPAPTVTATVPGPTVTVTATPKAVDPQPGDPMNALTAWTICRTLGYSGYLKDNPGSTVVAYRPGTDSKPNGDGTFTATVGMTGTSGNGGVVALCTIGGTLADPTIVSSTLKDTG
jgi:hypothetical protein